MKKILKGLRIVIVSVLAIIVLLCVGFYAVTWRRCRTISSIKSIPEGGYYEVEYRSDYKFDDFLKEGASSDEELVDFVRKKLFMNAPTEVDPKNQFSCSTMSIKSTDGDYLFGRDFDWLSPTTPILVHTKPKNGYESYSMTNIKYITDEYTLDDCIGKILTLSLPYMPLDGINEKGVSMSVMTVNEFAADQHTGKKGINTNTAIRLVLDKAADVDEAISLLEKYDMHASGIYKVNYHFLIADSKGNSAIVEYVNNQMKVIKKDGDFQVCTNFT